MAIRVKSLEGMLREIIASLQTGLLRRPAFTLLVGSGFSFPIIPTPTQMLKGDIAWWRFCKVHQIPSPFRNRADAIEEGIATLQDISEFEVEIWKSIHAKAAESESTAFAVDESGLPDLTKPDSVGRAYQAIMSEGLITNRMRRQYLRDAIKRSYPKVNGAHIFLAGILEAQEAWEWGAPFCRTIFTTNFDPLLQRSLQLVNKLYYMTDRPEVLEPPDDDEGDAIHLVYTHGSVHRYELLNTDDQIEHARKRNAPNLVDYLKRHGVIVIGYSGWRDTTMEALLSCSSFDSNLYWCDVHSVADAGARLRPEVLEILHAGEKNAYYVPISSADETMRQLHRELKLGDVPKFILSPVATMIAQLRSIEVPSESYASTDGEPKPVSGNLATLLEGALTRLEVARSAFDDPSIVRPASPQAKEEVANALVAQLMSDAFVSFSTGRLEQAIALWSSVIAAKEVPSNGRAIACYNRGVAYGASDKTTDAIEDYSAVIAMPDVSVELKAKALVNRGFAYGKAAKRAEEFDDYCAVIAMTDVPDGQKALALYNRGVRHASSDRGDEAISDYSAVISLSNAPAELRAKALCSRGVQYRKSGRTAEASADYAAVITMADVSPIQKASAFVGRSWNLFKSNDDVRSLVDDSRTALDLAPSTMSARMNLGLALLLTDDPESAKTEYEILLSQTSDASIIRSAIDDLETEVSKRPDMAGATEILVLLRSVAGLRADTIDS